jgi:hypothetical protein
MRCLHLQLLIAPFLSLINCKEKEIWLIKKNNHVLVETVLIGSLGEGTLISSVSEGTLTVEKWLLKALKEKGGVEKENGVEKRERNKIRNTPGQVSWSLSVT